MTRDEARRIAANIVKVALTPAEHSAVICCWANRARPRKTPVRPTSYESGPARHGGTGSIQVFDRKLGGVAFLH